MISLAAIVLSACVQATPPTLTSQTSLSQGTLPPPELAVSTQTAAATSLPPGPTQTSLPPATPGPSYQWQALAGGLARPTDLADPGDGSNMLLVVEQPGRIRYYKDGVILPESFLDISDRVGSGGNEQGLLGLALHPKFKENGYFYVNYTDTNGNTVIARFQAGKGLAKVDPASEKVLLRVRQPFPNHNGGSMVFGPDGYLYLGLGDGGSQGDPSGNGQNLNTLLGKILRVDIDQGSLYAIPKDNPFVHGGGLPEIWAYGLRNPWRFSFDRLTGDLFIADVGQNLYEEIDFQAAGSPIGVNYGWNYREGLHPYHGTPPSGASLVDPVFEYGHDLGCSIIGGYVYRGNALPELNGVYIYGDYCSGRVWGLRKNSAGQWQNQLLAETHLTISSFAQDQAGELYLLDTGGGQIFKLVK